MLVDLATAPLGLVVYIGEFSLDEGAHVSTWSELARFRWRQRRYISAISSSAECGVGMMLNGTGSGEPCRMYSMYSLERTNFHSMSWSVCTQVKKKVKAEHLYSASSWEPHPRSDQVWIKQLLPWKYTVHRTRLSPRKHSPDGATIASGSNHLITACYSFIEPERMKGWVNLVSWPTADGLPI